VNLTVKLDRVLLSILKKTKRRKDDFREKEKSKMEEDHMKRS